MYKIKSWAQAVWDKAWTKIWAQLQLLGGALMAIISYMASVIHDPNVQSTLSAVAMPTWVAVGIAVFGAITLTSIASE